MKKLSHQFLFIIHVFFLILTLLPVTKASANSKENKARPWWGEVETGLIYDNNILQVDNNKESDVISESSLFMAYQAKAIKWHALAILDRYLDNSELSYSYFEIGAERALSQNYYGNLSLNISPTSSIDKQDPNRPPFSLGSYGLNLLVERDTAKFGTIGLNFAYTRLDYDPPFDAKDSTIYSLSPSLFYRINRSWHFFSEYSYSLGKARRGLIPVGLNLADDDISYKAHSLSLLTVHKLSKKTSLRFRYKIRQKRFTPDARDTFHLGRKDTTHSIYAEIKQWLMKGIVVRGRVNRVSKNSNRSFVDFDENLITLSIAYQF